MRSRFLQILSLLVLVISIASCSGGTKNPPSPPPVINPDPEPEPDPKPEPEPKVEPVSVFVEPVGTNSIVRPDGFAGPSAPPGYRDDVAKESKVIELNGKKIAYEVAGDKVVFGGDVVFGSVDTFEAYIEHLKTNLEIATQGLGIADPNRLIHSRLWPENIVYYEISSSVSDPNLLRNINYALFYWQLYSPLRFVPDRTKSDRLIFHQLPAQSANSCFVDLNTTEAIFQEGVGHFRDLQYIYLGTNCSMPTAAHEIGHSIGLLHEHQRCDRDDFISINPANSDLSLPQLNSQVGAMFCEDNVMELGDYDKTSIMHYYAGAFGNGSGDVFVSLDDKNPVPKATEWWISEGDIKSILDRYRTSEVCDPLDTNRCSYEGFPIYAGASGNSKTFVPEKFGTHMVWVRAEMEDMYLVLWRQDTEGKWSIVDWKSVPAGTINSMITILPADGTTYAWEMQRQNYYNTATSVTFDLWLSNP